MRSSIALLSDFGTQDIYVGVLKAVVARINPEAITIDLTHDIPPGDIRQAAFRLWQALPSMPRGCVLLAVVDPGVGTSRRPLAVQCEGFSCVGPDNGVFTYILQGRRDARAVEISAAGKSNTFHGRDIFAPAAALLASGTEIERLGPFVSSPVTIPWPLLSCEKSGEILHGETLFPDRFGNVVTSIGELTRDGENVLLDPWIPGGTGLKLPASRLRIRCGRGLELSLSSTFSDVPKGFALAYIGSDKLLEIGVNRGSAVDSLGLASGMDVTLSWR